MELKTPALLLAPMEGVIDRPMRTLLCEQGGFDFCVSEFIRVSQEVPPPRVLQKFVPELTTNGRTPSGHFVQVQLLGSDPERLAQTAKLACDLGAPAIDLNFGCPSITVNRSGAGAVLLRQPRQLRSIVEAVRKAVPSEIPVSAKLRLGWDSADPIFENAQRVAEGGADWIVIHGRTRAQQYAPSADWRPIGEVRKQLSIPVIANGDIRNTEEFLRCKDITGCEHFMMGRGALGNPLLGLQISEVLAHGVVRTELTPERWLRLFERFAELSAAFTSFESYIPRRIKQWVKLATMTATSPSWIHRCYEEIKRFETTEEIISWLRAHAKN